MTLDEQLEAKGMITISERLQCNNPMDAMVRHANVHTLNDLLEWVQIERRSNMEMIARHELGIRTLDSDIEDFVYGKSAVLWEVHVNLLHTMKSN